MYNFKTGGKAYPFIEALVGYTAITGGGDVSGLSWGGRMGLKIAVTDKGLLNLGIQYTQITLDTSESTEKSGMDNFFVSAGFTIWI